MVTMRSFIAWSSAAWVLGGVRLISSASRSWVKIGPLVRTKPLVWKLNRLVPRTSPGMRSGVNWIRPKSRRRLAAKAWASSVLAVPGTPSSRIWPPTRRLVSISSTTSSWPMTALAISPRMASASDLISWISIDDSPSPPIYVAGDGHQRPRLPASLRLHGAFRPDLVHASDDGGAIEFDPAQRAHAAEPGDELSLGQCRWRMELTGGIAQRLLNIALHHDLVMAGEAKELGHVEDEPPLARIEG